MKNRKILFAIFILIATALFAVFIYDLLNNLNSDSLVNLNNNNNLIIKSHVSIRDVKYVTSDLNNNTDNSTVIFNNEPSSSTVNLILGISFGIAGAIAVGYLAFRFLYVPDVGIIENDIHLSRYPVNQVN